MASGCWLVDMAPCSAPEQPVVARPPDGWATEVSWSVTLKTNKFALGVMAAGGLVLAGCSSEIGRVPMLDTDITCLHKQMAGPMFLSFPLAANTCQRMSNGGFVLGESKARPLPLNLKGAPDLQKLADEYGYTYTR